MYTTCNNSVRIKEFYQRFLTELDHKSSPVSIDAKATEEVRSIDCSKDLAVSIVMKSQYTRNERERMYYSQSLPAHCMSTLKDELMYTTLNRMLIEAKESLENGSIDLARFALIFEFIKNFDDKYLEVMNGFINDPKSFGYPEKE